jgi:hypothetical protein
MKILKFIILLQLLFVMHSCYIVHKSTIQEFDYCYSNSETGIESLININGYYEVSYASLNENKIIRKEAIVFYDDGIYLEFPSVEMLYDSLSVSRKSWGEMNVRCGIYKYFQDTIKVQYVYIGSATSGCETIYYKVKRFDSIDEILCGNCDTPPKMFLKNNQISVSINFIPYSKIPNANQIWLKQKKWFWCNEQEWKAYKDSIH